MVTNVQGRRCFVHSKHRDEMAANLVLCDVDGYSTKSRGERTPIYNIF